MSDKAGARPPHVRRASFDDWPPAESLFREGDNLHAAIAPGYFREGARSSNEWRALLDDSTAAVFVAEAPPHGAVGLVVLRIYDTPDSSTMVPRRRGHVETLIVTARHRRHGGGRALMTEAATWARGRGAVELVLTAWAGNPLVEGFYARLGYRTLSRVLSLDLGRR